jgi:exodeoxyribonuclease VII small subunit
MSAKRDTQTFEQLYQQLEETVEKLERGGLPLEQSIEQFEQGMALAKRCQEILDKAEQRIIKLRESFAEPAGAEPALAEAPLAGEDTSLDEEVFELDED